MKTETRGSHTGSPTKVSTGSARLMPGTCAYCGKSYDERRKFCSKTCQNRDYRKRTFVPKRMVAKGNCRDCGLILEKNNVEENFSWDAAFVLCIDCYRKDIKTYEDE
jgi:hypothetical protein